MYTTWYKFNHFKYPLANSSYISFQEDTQAIWKGHRNIF